MDGLVKILESKKEGNEFSFKNLFVPLTTAKAITWIAIIGFIVYFNMLFNGFVWEDNTLIIYNLNGHSFNIFDLKNTFNQGIQFRPFTAFFVASLYSLFGNTAFLYHLTQLILHIGGTILIFLLFKKFLKKNIAFFISLLFLIHPINTESVDYIGALNNPLFTFLGLLGLVYFINSRINKKSVIVTSLLLFSSLLSKETGILFFLLLIVYSYFFSRKTLVYSIAITIVDLLIFAILRLTAGFNPDTGYFAPIYNLPLLQRLENIPAIFTYYIKTFFMPIQLSTNQLWTVSSINLHEFYLPLLFSFLIISLLTIYGLYLYRSKNKSFPIFIFFLIWFLVGIVGYLQIIPLNQTVADHWFYFPIIGLLGIIGILIQSSPLQKNNIKKVGIILGVILLVVLSTRTIVRNANWSDTLTLFTHDSMTSNNFNIEENLGTEYTNRAQYKLALQHYLKAVEYSPNERNLLNTAATYLYFGDVTNAKKYIKMAKAHPHKNIKDYLQYSYNNGALFLILHYPQKAPEYITYALQDFPNDPGLWGDLAIAKYTIKDQKGALAAAKKAKELLPNEKTNYLYIQISTNQPLDLNQLFH